MQYLFIINQLFNRNLKERKVLNASSTSSGLVSHVILRWMKLRILFPEERGISLPAILETDLRKFRN